VRAIASDEAAARISSASARPALASSAAGTTRFTRPMASASGAASGRGWRSSSRRSLPRTRSGRKVATSAGTKPIRTSVYWKVAPSAATTKSHAVASPQPPATQAPCTSATVSTSCRRSDSKSARSASESRRFASGVASWSEARCARSAPAEKCRPAPASRSARTPSARQSRAKRSPSAATIAGERALARAGSASTIRTIAPSRCTSTGAGALTRAAPPAPRSPSRAAPARASSPARRSAGSRCRRRRARRGGGS